MDSLIFRPAKDEDFVTLHAMYMHPSTNPYLAYDVMDAETFKTVYLELVASGSLYIAETNGILVGSYHLVSKKYRQSDTVYLSTFVVDPAARGKGYAVQILHHIISELSAQKKNRIELEVSANNEPAIALYHKMGFVIEGRIRQSYKIGQAPVYYDDYLMAILLTPLPA